MSPAVGAVIVEQAVHDRGAAGIGEQLALVADQAARGRVEHQPHATAARGSHLGHLGFALGKLLHHDAAVLFVDVDDHFFDRLQQFAAGIAIEQHLRPRHRQLESLAPHGLDQDAELQLAAAGNLHGILLGGFADPQRDVALGLAQQPFAYHPALHLVALGAGERRIVDPKGHR